MHSFTTEISERSKQKKLTSFTLAQKPKLSSVKKMSQAKFSWERGKKYMECTQEYWYRAAWQDSLTFLTKVPADPLYQVHDKVLNCDLEETFFLFQDRFFWNLATKRKFGREKYFIRVFFPI